MKNKKGDITVIFVMITIVTLVLVAALLYSEYNIFAKISGNTQYSICRQSVEASSLMRIKNIELSPFLKCQTEQITIKKNDVDEAKKTIANAMYNCYYQFAQGEKELFSGEGRFCFICSTIDFEGDGTKIKELPEFQKYLFTQMVDSKHTYAQYLYKDKAEEKKKSLGNQYTAPLLRQKTAVLFTYDKCNIALYKTMTSVKTDWVDLSLLEACKPALEETPLESAKQYLTVGAVRLLNPYSAEEVNKLNCQQKIAQANK